MAFYVRLAKGGRDVYEPYDGCAKCGYPLTPEGDPDEDERLAYCDPFGCPNCGSFFQMFAAMTQVKLVRWNAEAWVKDDGALVVVRWRTQVGYYPDGAWLGCDAD